MGNNLLNGLAGKSWDELIALRGRIPSEMQPQVAPFEHRAYAREEVAQNPLMALPYAFMIPGYQAYKVLKGEKNTPPSLEQMKQGYIGTWEGLKKGLAGGL